MFYVRVPVAVVPVRSCIMPAFAQSNPIPIQCETRENPTSNSNANADANRKFSVASTLLRRQRLSNVLGRIVGLRNG